MKDLKKILLPVILLCLLSDGYSQIAPDTYWVTFTDKKKSAYSTRKPELFLSERAIKRRVKQGIPISESDFPVNDNYLDSLISLGIKIHNVSKWLNGASIISTDTNLIDTLHYLSFIKDPIIRVRKEPKYSSQKKDVFIKKSSDDIDSFPQLQMLNLDDLHQSGYSGEGVLVGVLDAGFNNVDKIESLEHIWNENRVLGIKDFVKDSDNILTNHSHGTLVLSIIAANWESYLTGSAPNAEFLLIRTENGNSEYLVEEYDWIAGAEYADSMGVDVINSSLGYSEFDDPNQNHVYEDLDGKTIPITIGATIAASKGIVVVNSAGNSGGDDWFYITAPGDADSIITVGAVDADSVITNFSSHGPTSDGRTKPDVCAMGFNTKGQIVPGYISDCNGTSCSAPLITGLVACLMNSSPASTAMGIIDAIILSSHLNKSPDNTYGHGIPDGNIAASLLRSEQELTSIRLFPNPTNGPVYFIVDVPWLQSDKEGIIYLYDLNGRILNNRTEYFTPGLNIFYYPDTNYLKPGYYILQAIVENRNYLFSIIKTN